MGLDSLPVFIYQNIKRTIQPSVVKYGNDFKFTSDSLLSIYLEDSVVRPIECEGIFHYKICLFIDEFGKIYKTKFDKDDYNYNVLIKEINLALFKINLIPAKRKDKSLPVKIWVKVKLDLYNPVSDFRKGMYQLTK